MTTTAPSLPLGVALPSDVAAAAELIDEVLELAREEQAALELLAQRQQDADAVI